MFKSDESEKHPTEAEIDEALKQSFPASDPPSWTLGIEQPAAPQKESDQEVSIQEEGDSDTASAGRAS